MIWEEQTLDFYNQHTDFFVSGTMNAEMGETQTRFLSRIPSNGLILDYGCGSGRDTKAFLDAGFRVEATDGSEEICLKASGFTGIQVKKMLFSELNEQEKYDGIWACASILHLPKTDLEDVLKRIEKALKPGAVLYASFKYGTHEGMRNGRYFTDFTEETLHEFWKNACILKIFDLWITRDVRPERREEQWINLLAIRD